MAINPQLPPTSSENPTVSSVLRTVLLCDWADSTHLIDTLGDARAVGLMQKHDQFVRETLLLTNGRLIDKADGILTLFERPIQALDFALRYQQQMRVWGAEYQQPIQARIGIHVGDVMTWENQPDQVAAGAKPLEVEGFAKPVAARLMSLAMPGQILLSGMAQSLAQRAQLELGERGQKLRWILHGRYNFKGVPAPMLVHEVGDAEFSPLRAPPSTAKAWKEIPLWRRPPVLVLEGLLTTGLIAGFIWSTFQSTPAIAFYERDWVVMGDVQNLSREKLFNDSLDTAIRVGLEQSAYVNVISDSQEAEALKRMQREGKAIDRQTGAELALREGAKALILPTLTEVGGRLRITAEVIDPNTGVTVYTESADAKNADDVLPALDSVLEKLRTRLGEPVSLVDGSSKPLEQVTTPDIEALRAFSLGIEARVNGKPIEALALYNEAVRLDPDFSMAYLRIAIMHYVNNDSENARRFLKIADSKRTRLSTRESLLLDASLALFKTPVEMMAKLKLLATMYPDEYRAYYNYSYFANKDAQQYSAAKDFIVAALSVHNPDRGAAYHQLGIANLALGNYEAATDAFKKFESLSTESYHRDLADTYAAQRQFQRAYKILETQTPTELSGLLIQYRISDISYPIDQGQWAKAAASMESLASDVEKVQSPQVQWTSTGLKLSLRSYAPNVEFSRDLHAYLASQQVMLKQANLLDRRHLVFQILAAGWMAANTGDAKSARAAMLSAGKLADADGFPANADMHLALQAELDLAAGQAATAIAKLEPRAGKGNELYFLHSVLMRAYAANKDFEKAIQQADWLVANRGRAYAEFNSGYMWQPANVVESNLALISAAHYANKIGRNDLAAKYRDDFAAAWPNGEQLSQVTRRIQKLN